MQDKTIKGILKRKFNDWVDSIEDESVKLAVQSHSIITGGSIVSLMHKEMPKDYDIYFDDKETVLKVAQYYIDQFNKKHGKIKNKIGHDNKAFVLDGAKDLEEQLEKEGYPVLDQTDEGKPKRSWDSHMLTNCGPERVKIIVRSDGVASEHGDIHLEESFEDVYDTLDENDHLKSPEQVLEEADDIPAAVAEEITEDEKEKYRPIFLTTNAITLSNQIQIVVRFYGNAEQIHSNYDFVHCMAYFLPKDNTLEYSKETLRAIMTKTLFYRGSKYPLCSVIRTRKFLKRGWNINAGQYLKMFFQISKLDLTDIAVLEDQLVGVDSAYFMILIDALRSKMDSDKNFDLANSSAYVVSLIDKIF